MSNLKCCCSKDDREEKLLEAINRHKGKKGALIPVLHEAQDIYGYLPSGAQKIISDKLDIPVAEIYGVVTFYTQFSLVPKGKYNIQVCMGTACYVKGAADVLEKVKQKTGISEGECTEDGLFSLEACRCIGACGLAPVIMINDEVYGRLTPGKVEKIIDRYKDAG